MISTNIKITVNDAAVIRILDPGVKGSPPNSAFGATQASVYNLGPNRVWLGGSDLVNFGNGYPLDPGKDFVLGPAGPTDELWGVCATGETAELRVIRQDK